MRRIRSKSSLMKFYVDKMSSQSETLFFDMVESIYGVKIDRQFFLSYRFFDGRYKDILIEIDSDRWHSSKKQKSRDLWKNKIAMHHGFKIYRIKVNSKRHVPVALEENKKVLEEIFK